MRQAARFLGPLKPASLLAANASAHFGNAAKITALPRTRPLPVGFTSIVTHACVKKATGYVGIDATCVLLQTQES